MILPQLILNNANIARTENLETVFTSVNMNKCTIYPGCFISAQKINDIGHILWRGYSS